MIYDFKGQKVAFQGDLFLKDNGVLRARMIAEQMTKLAWTTTADGMPITDNGGTYNAGGGATGMPYSSASMEDGYIGISVSIYSFLSALHNPRSMLYTTPSKGYTGGAFYGTVCTGLVCAAWGLPCLVTTAAFPKADFIREVSWDDIRIGDMLLIGGHAKLVVDVIRDATGAVTHARAYESTRPVCIDDGLQTFENFKAYNSGAKVCRFNGINSVSAYNPLPLLPQMDEIGGEIEFPDVMTCFGDKVTRLKGTDITINVLDSSGYSSIQVFRNRSRISTHSVADFTLEAPDVGLYEVRMIGTEKQSSTYFDIVDCKASIDGNTLSFWTDYQALAVGAYPSYTVDSNGKATTWNNPKNVAFLTEEEVVNGKMDITKLRADGECDGGVRIYVRGAYGSVSLEVPY